MFSVGTLLTRIDCSYFSTRHFATYLVVEHNIDANGEKLMKVIRNDGFIFNAHPNWYVEL